MLDAPLPAPPNDNLPRGTICIEEMSLGLSRSVSKVVTDDDIAAFAAAEQVSPTFAIGSVR